MSTTKLAEAAQQYLIATAHLGACPGTRDVLERALAAVAQAEAKPANSTPAWRCKSCLHLYEEKVTQCDCLTSGQAQEWVEVAVVEAAQAEAKPAPAADGWKLVPLEPTPEMIEAGNAAAHAGGCDLWQLKREVMNAWPAMLAAAPAAPADGDWTTPTTYEQRFTQAVTLLCGRKPEPAMVAAWLDKSSDELQGFAVEHGPAWAQGIVLLDAAAVMADTPTEGVAHGERAPAAPAPEPLTDDDVRLCLTGETSGAVSEREFRAFRAAERAHGIGIAASKGGAE